MIDEAHQQELEEWARSYGGTAILGFIATLLIGGKFLHFVFQKRGLIFGYLIVPPAIISGLIGLVWFSTMELLDPLMTSDLRSGLEALKGNLINFVFAALILGITCGRANSQHSSSFRAIVLSLLHEGMPMIIYSQILIWGQSTCCLLALCIANVFGAGIPGHFSAMIPLGVEAGNDISITLTFGSKFWSRTVVEEAESLGLVAACLFGIALFSMKPYLIARGLLGPSYARGEASNAIQQVTGQAEAFEPRGGGGGGSNLRGYGYSSAIINISPKSPTMQAQDEIDGNPVSGTDSAYSGGHVSLGAHISMIALTVFLSFGLSLLCHLLELELNISHHFLSGIRMFKLAMCCALVSMQLLLRRSKLRFNREWFMRLCGLMLDLLVISALSKAYPKPDALESTHYLVCGVFVFVSLLWHAFCFVFMANSLFPNYWYERALTLSGDALGHCYTGLLFVRTLDPAMESPVPAAYAYKLMLFFIPSSGGKNTIVVTIVESHGPLAALIVCICVVATWIIIFDTYFKHRFISKMGKSNSRVWSDKAIYDGEKASSEQLMSFLSKEKVKVGEEYDGGRWTMGAEDLDLPASSSSVSTAISSSSVGDLGEVRDPAAAFAHLPRVVASEGSSILNHLQMQHIASWLPESFATKSWRLCYSLRRHGASLDTLLSLSGGRAGAHIGSRRTAGGSPCVVVIEDSWGYVFGGFVAPEFHAQNSYYGDGRSFVFSLMPNPRVYKWTGKNDLLVLSNEKCFAMGGGGDGFAVQLDDELDTGVSSRSDTYDNDTLSSNEFFKCLNVEVWMLDSFTFSA